MNASSRSRSYAPLLWFLLALFCLRVIGQMLVAFFDVSFLPPMGEWYSGLMSYPMLLPLQALILALMIKICTDFSRERGFFVVPRRGMGQFLRWFSYLYFASMVLRYGITMAVYPERRWFGGAMPIFFHFVLAGFLLAVGHFHYPPRRSTTTCAIAGFIFLGAIAWTPTEIGSWWLARKLEARPAEFGVQVERRATMTTSDGIALVADIYHPRKRGPSPTILVRIPLSETFTNRLYSSVVGRFWAERGYTVIIQGTRGRYGSDGRYEPFIRERQDGLEALQWIAKQPWFNERLGMWGGSYFGYTQWVVADQANPGPLALMIQLASTNFYGMFYPGGAFSLESALYWAGMSHGEQDLELSADALQRGYDGFPLIEADNRAIRDIPFFNDWVNHSERDEYWHRIDGEDRTRRLVAPVLLMAGWYDPFLPTQLDDFMRIRREAQSEIASASRLIIGPWAHARTVTLPGGITPENYRRESLAPSVPWFDQHLRSGKAAIQAPVRIYVMGENVWREEKEWPLARTRYIPYYLQSGGKANSLKGDGVLMSNPPPAQEASDTYLYEPLNPVPTAGGAMLGPRAGIALQNAVENREDVLVYGTPPLEENLEVTGPIKLVLFVSTTAPHTDFTGKLVDVHPDGSAYNVSEGILRRSYHDQKPTEIHIDLWPTSIVFRKGHRIRLEISSSNHPRFDRNPNTGRQIATETRPIVAKQTIYHALETPSRLILPVVPKQEPTRASP